MKYETKSKILILGIAIIISILFEIVFKGSISLNLFIEIITGYIIISFINSKYKPINSNVNKNYKIMPYERILLFAIFILPWLITDNKLLTNLAYSTLKFTVFVIAGILYRKYLLQIVVKSNIDTNSK